MIRVPIPYGLRKRPSPELPWRASDLLFCHRAWWAERDTARTTHRGARGATTRADGEQQGACECLSSRLGPDSGVNGTMPRGVLKCSALGQRQIRALVMGPLRRVDATWEPAGQRALLRPARP
jgi:hypothetical protein